MNITKITQAMTNLVNWVKTGLNAKADVTAVNAALANKQTKALVGTAAPAANVGLDGDIFLVIDP